MIYDCIPFFNELDILKLRMQILSPYVDKFVIEESSVTFSGEPKEMIFDKNREMFAEFADKIEYVAVTDSPLSGVTTHERDKFQKNKLILGLKACGCKPEDIIIFSDVDEIPNPKTLTDILENFDDSKIYHFAQRMFYCFLNMEEISGNLLSITGEFPGVERKMWLGTKVCSFGNLPKEGIVYLREVSPCDERSVRVEDGGWHFGYMGGNGEKDVAKRIGIKVQAAAHQEYNKERYLSEAVDRLLCGEDIFDRNAKFIRVSLDESYPEYLREHQEEYDFLLAPKVSKTGIIKKKVKLTVKEKLRKAKGLAVRLCPFLFYAGLTLELLAVILDKSKYVNPYEGMLFRITFLLFAIKLCLTGYEKKEWLGIIVLEFLAFVSYRITGKNDVIRIVTFMAACKGIPLKQMLKYTFYVTLTGCMAIVLLAVTGIYGDMALTIDYGGSVNPYDIYNGVAVAKEETRYVLGMGHPNAVSCMFFMLVALGVYVYFEKIKWYGYVLLMLLNLGVYKLSDSKTGMLIISIFLLGACLVKYVKILQEKKALYICGALVFALCIGFSIDAAIQAQTVRDAKWSEYYRAQEITDPHIKLLARVDDKITGRIVSLTNSERKDGMISTWSAFSCPENMSYYFDMGWVKLFYRYGVLPGILYIVACLLLLKKLYENRDVCGLVLFASFSVYTVVEAHLISPYIGRNYLLMMIGYYVFGKVIEEREKHAKL